MGDIRGRVKWRELTVVDCLRPCSLPARDGAPEGSASWSPSSTIACVLGPRAETLRFPRFNTVRFPGCSGALGC